MKTAPRLAIVLLILIGCVGCDQATKAIARDHLEDRPPVSLWGDTLRLEYAENTMTGAGFLLLSVARRRSSDR